MLTSLDTTHRRQHVKICIQLHFLQIAPLNVVSLKSGHALFALFQGSFTEFKVILSDQTLIMLVLLLYKQQVFSNCLSPFLHQYHLGGAQLWGPSDRRGRRLFVCQLGPSLCPWHWAEHCAALHLLPPLHEHSRYTFRGKSVGTKPEGRKY